MECMVTFGTFSCSYAGAESHLEDAGVVDIIKCECSDWIGVVQAAGKTYP
jgi:hypothetical protein